MQPESHQVWRIPAGYQTTPIAYTFGHLSVTLTQVTNLDDLLEALIALGPDHPDYRDDRIPYWADLWHSALALARYLVQENVVKPGLRITELGCGLGLPGLVAGKLGGRVTFTDYLPDAVEFARYNWEANTDQPAAFMTMDWRDPLPAAAAELLLASDVAYETRAFAPLLHCFGALLPPGGGRLLVSEPGRAATSPWLDTLRRRFPHHHLAVYPETYRGVTVKVNILDLDTSVTSV